MVALFRLHRVRRFAVLRVSLRYLFCLCSSWLSRLHLVLTYPPFLVSLCPLFAPGFSPLLRHKHTYTYTYTYPFTHTRRSLLFAAQLHLRLWDVCGVSHCGHHGPRRRRGKVQARAPEEARLLLHVDRPRRVPMRYGVLDPIRTVSPTLGEAEEGERPAGWS